MRLCQQTILIATIVLSFNLSYQQKPIKVAIKANNGQYLARCRNCISGSHQDSAMIYQTNPFNLQAVWTVQFFKGKVAFKADNGKYLTQCYRCIKNNKEAPKYSVFVSADNPQTDSDARWQPYKLQNGKIAFKGQNNLFLARRKSQTQNKFAPQIVSVEVSDPNKCPYAQWTIQIFEKLQIQ